MSSVITKKYTIVLYQAGLGSGHDHFNETFKKISGYGGKHMVFIDSYKTIATSYLDMTDFNCERGCFWEKDEHGYLCKSATLTAKFNTQIMQMIDIMKANPNKVLHVKTHLTDSIDFHDGFESIENQKIKLEYIINALQSYDIDVTIILVGHSQGGLVNIETAIDMPEKVDRIISISTPYSPVGVAKNILYVDKAMKALGMDGLLTANTPEKLERYETRANTLTSADYFSTLKSKWNALTVRPRLLTITGTSGYVTKQEYDNVYAGNNILTPVPQLIHKRLYFDGLVLTDEQKDIKHDCELDFVTENMQGFSGLFASLEILFDPNTSISTEKIQVINAIFKGVDRDASFSDSKHQNFYDIYADDFSHMYLAQHKEVVLTIMGFTE